VPVSQQWAAVARHISSQHPSVGSQHRSPISSLLHCNSALSPSTPQFCFRSFRRSFHPHAPLPGSPRNASASNTAAEKKKRQVRIGPLPCGELPPKTIENIFGRGISAADGNAALRILHHRRVSGSLADHGASLTDKFRNISPAISKRALEWLRKEFPVNEARAAEEWAEKEANRIAYELWLSEEEGGKKLADPAKAWREMEEEQREKRVYQTGILHHGPSVFQENIKLKRMKRLEEATKRAEEKEAKEAEEAKLIASGEYVRSPGGTALIKPGQTTYVDIFGKEVLDDRKKWADYYNMKAASPFKSEEEMAKAKTTFQRVFPMTVFGIITCGLASLFAYTYTPPDEAYRLFPNVSPAFATIATILALNAGVFVVWRLKPFWPFLMKYFMNVPGWPRPVQAVLNIFSHQQWDHFFANMLWVCSVGYLCHETVGRGTFLSTYVAAGTVGSLMTLYCANLGWTTLAVHSLGASGAMYGITTLYLLVTQQEKIKLPFLKDAEVGFWPKLLLIAIVMIEIRGFWRGSKKLDHPSHLGGIMTGAAVAAWLKWREGSSVGEETKGQTLDPVGVLKAEVEEVKSVVGVKKDGEGKQ
jgi:rhomboid-like protein